MRRAGIYCLISLSIVVGCFVLFLSANFPVLSSPHEPPLFNPLRGYALALFTLGGIKFFLPLWFSSFLINKYQYHETTFITAFWSCIETLAAFFGSLLLKKIFEGKFPGFKSKEWIKFSFVVIPSVLFVSLAVSLLGDLVLLQDRSQWLNWDRHWVPAKVLGYLLVFPFFAGLFTCQWELLKFKNILRDLMVFVLAATLLLCVFYLDLTRWNFDPQSHRYLALLVLIGVGLSASPMGLSLSILLLGYLVVWNRYGLMGYRSVLADSSALQLQVYLFVIGFFVPLLARLFREKSELETLKENYQLVQKALAPSTDDVQLKRLGVYSENIAIGLFDLEYRCLELNQKMADIYGLSVKDAVGKTAVERLGENSKLVFPVFEEVVKTRKPAWNLKFRFEFKNSESAPYQNFLVSYIPTLSPDGQVVAVIAVVTPLKSQSQMEEEGFSSALPLAFSHDLQEPLRNVFQSLKILSEKLKNETDFEKNNYVESALGSASRMKVMVDSLLEINRLNHEALKSEEFEASELIEECIADLDYLLEEVEAQVVCDLIPRLRGDKKLLSRVFQNLLSNSIKYRSSSRQLNIRISSKLVSNKIQITVADNGIGFDSREAEKIFRLFYRLHTFEESEGYGVGLTVSKEIVELHQGEMWAESLHEGAAFHFTLPA